VAFDVCAANRVLNMLASEVGKDYDDGGRLAQKGKIDLHLLNSLNELDYYKKNFPKSLANEFGTDIVYPMIRRSGIDINDALRTYVEHIVFEISEAIKSIQRSTPGGNTDRLNAQHSMLVTGGGAFNDLLVEQLKEKLTELNFAVVVPEENLVKYKEAMIMAFMGVLRWRQEYNVLSSVTGAARDNIGGALWIGQEA
jgi:anhydro-N-acetylmuramic acid kinase